MYFTTVLLLLVINSAILIANALEEYVCNTVDVRAYKDLDQLENCTVVVGNVYLVFPLFTDKLDYTWEEINSRSFPLREVTGYMLFHTIKYVDSLGNLFPNLTVIRGQRLFSNYALVLYDTDLAEISLRNLLKIGRGSLRIAGINHRLCLPKIDWHSILMSGHLVIIGENITSSECPSNLCHTCPNNSKYCWNNKVCQRFDITNRVYGSNVLKCHHLCLGKCVDSTASGCFVCRDKSELGRCVQSCSKFRYLNTESRRCITADQCIQQGRKLYLKDCVQHCPPGYMAKVNTTEMILVDHTCEPCADKCKRICSNIPEIRTIAQLEDLGTGCTIINGSLEINFMDDVFNLTAELENYLGDIEEIHGTLKIHRSTPLTSITFLNKLRVVYGTKQKTASYSIRIFGNQNLQSLFDFRIRDGLKLDVKYGTVQIFQNHLLCETEIELFKSILTPNEARQKDFMTNNGYQRSCKNDNIKTSSKVISHKEVEISWEDLLSNKTEIKISGYLLQYVRIENYEIRNFDENMLYERDSCSSHGWKQIVLKKNDFKTSNSTMSYRLTNLSQFTYYAFTIQRYNYNSIEDVAKHNNSLLSGTSEVNIFQTLMNIPSRVTKFSAVIKTTNSIEVEWSMIERERKGITRFLILYFERPISIKQLDARDYCKEPIDFEEVSMIENKLDNIGNEFINDDRCCENCCMNQFDRDEKIEADENDFQDSMKKLSKSEMRLIDDKYIDKVTSRSGYIDTLKFEQDANKTLISNLTVFTNYAFYIFVCDDNRCSDYELIHERTALEPTFDSIELLPKENVFQRNAFRIQFDEPKNKNGLITSYIIEIIEIKENINLPFSTICISRQQHAKNKFEFSIDSIQEGDYAFRIKAISLAQHGRFTDWHSFKIVHTSEKSSFGLIIFSLSIIVAFIAGIVISYYYKHKILIILRNQNDTSILMHEMEPTDFQEFSMKHRSFDRLSDITEYDE